MATAAVKVSESTIYLAAFAQLGYTFRQNLTNDDIEVNGEPITDPLTAQIRVALRDAGYHKMNIAEDIWVADAFANAYHPIREWLASLHWDGQDHIANLGACFTDDLGMFDVFLRKWLIGAIAKAHTGERNPMLVLDGSQDLGKSYFARWLCPNPKWFVSAPLQPDDKDCIIRLMSMFVWEVGELGATTRRADRESLKHFLSLENVSVRKPFGKHDTRKSALASFIGTVNNEAGILEDPTGNTRFRIARLTSINWQYSSLDRDQIWAQAVALWQGGETSKLDAAQQIQSSGINQEYEVENIAEGLIQQHCDFTLDPSDFVPSHVLRLTLENYLKGTSTQISMQISSAMKKRGCESTRQFWAHDGKQYRGFTGVRIKSP